MTENPYFLARYSSADAPHVGTQPNEDFVVTRDICTTHQHFEFHRHDTDELMWIRAGRLDLHLAGGRRFSLHHEHMAWIPAQTQHEATLVGTCELLCLFAAPTSRPAGTRWHTPQVLATSTLMGQLVHHLRDLDRPRSERALSHQLLTTLLEGASTRSDALAVPRDQRALLVAEAVLANPADTRTLDELARSVYISARTLTRIFVTETGLPFGKWRSKARLDHSLVLLAKGLSVEAVAAAVGYTTTSAFIEAFKITSGSTPGAYRRQFPRT